MDLGVVCHTYKQLYNELLEQCSSTDQPLTRPACEDPTPCPTLTSDNMITLLSSVIGILVVVLMFTVIGWTVTCTVARRRGVKQR